MALRRGFRVVLIYLTDVIMCVRACAWAYCIVKYREWGTRPAAVDDEDHTHAAATPALYARPNINTQLDNPRTVVSFLCQVENNNEKILLRAFSGPYALAQVFYSWTAFYPITCVLCKNMIEWGWQQMLRRLIEKQVKESYDESVSLCAVQNDRISPLIRPRTRRKNRFSVNVLTHKMCIRVRFVFGNF